MAILVYGPSDRESLRHAGDSAAATLAAVCSRVKPGITTADIDRWVREDTAARVATPSQLGFKGFPAAVCTSVNDVVCHGVPSARVVLRDGDIINVDVTSHIGGFHGDTSRTLVLGAITADQRRVAEGAESCMWAGIEAVRPGARLGDVGAAIAKRAADFGCAVVREFGGHGIGRQMHMAPHVAHVGRAGTGVRLRAGMAFTIEPMLTLTNVPLEVDADAWTVRTADGSPSAQFEHTVLVTETGVEVVTRPPA